MTKPIKVTRSQYRRLVKNLGTPEEETMTQDELGKCVRAKLAGRMAINVVFIQQRYHVLQSQARRCILDLQEAGLISWEWDPKLGGYAVLKQEVTHGQA